jgi:nucleoside-diphosphate-sugar epimerase
LVTGGAGLIGSYLVEHLVREGAQVRVADNLGSGSLKNLSSCLRSIDFLKLDLQDAVACRRAVEGMDTVFDLAARTVGIGYSSQHHGEMFYDSMTISMNTLEAARQAGIRHYLFASSSCVYPDGSHIPTPEEDADRNLPESANSGYGWAKRMFELMATFYAQEYGMKVAIVRLVNAYGPRYHWDQEEPHVIPALIQRLLRGENPLLIWGSGRQTRSFIHASDVAMLMKLVSERATNAEPINIGCSEETTISDLVGELTTIAGYEGEIIFDPSKPEGPPRKGLDLSRQRNLIADFRPEFSLQDGLRQTFEAARELYPLRAAVSQRLRSVLRVDEFASRIASQ